ncbi:polyprenyl synthetase family protein [Nonomuraea sp. NPDC050404]|uniref:polyprenyl synthetase family protein n=1 Tax=Nonomuraea sp. NPDC050404 TaxID=3155783 RepID=UPI003405693B
MSTTVTAVLPEHVAVDHVLADFLEQKQDRHSDDPVVVMLIGMLREFLSGGKRLRPVLCICGWRAGGGGEEKPYPMVVRIAASLELFHTFALIHDDVMDESLTRRGRPTVQQAVTTLHSDHPRPAWFGTSTAILLGDLTLGWSYELVQAAELDAGKAARLWPALDDMRAQTLSGQYRDLLATGGRRCTVEQALDIVRRKTAAYTVEHPLLLGALLAGADREVLAACSTYGRALGEAFQLRDDLLGVFGDPSVTGKPVTDDLREAKATVLLAIARQRADACQRARLDALVGDPALDQDGATEAAWILTTTGARAAVEQMIDKRCRRAMAVLSGGRLHPAAAPLLGDLVAGTAHRSR